MRALFLGLAALLFLAAARAEVTRLDVVSQRLYGTFDAGDYILVEAKAAGELSPQEPIPGLDKVRRNARGQVEYATRVVLVIPAGRRQGNGVLLVDVPNRGNVYAHAIYNSPRESPFQSGTFEQGTGFLQENGFSVAEIFWELGKGAELPSFTDAGGKTLYVEGAGFAIFRDVAHFLSTAPTSPLAGRVKHTIASGKSQSGRFLKSFLAHGFNRVGDRQVFEGMHVIAALGGALSIMQTGAGPDSSSNAIPTFDDPEAGGENEPPVAVADLVAHVESRGERPPKMMFINTTTDYHARRASLGRTGSSASVEKPLPPSVRVYDIAGAPHVLVQKAPAACTLPQGRLDWTPVSRALLLRLVEWVAIDTQPPGNVLMTLEPATPDVALRPPKVYPDAVTLVPKRDADGHAMGGIRLPDLAAPLGKHIALNQPPVRACMLIGAYQAFTPAQLAERYHDRDGYVNRIRAASRQLTAQGYLLPRDAAVIIDAAASNSALARPRANSPG